MTLVLGVLNVTPDSFSDGGRFLDPGVAVAAGLRMVAEGADLVDVGGESTRPGAERVEPADELHRVLPVVTGLVAAGARVSVDTTRASVAAACLEAGASVVNDVSGGDSADLVDVVAQSGATYVLMHSRGPASAPADYSDVVAEVCTELEQAVTRVIARGVAAERVVLDPGLGFAKRAEHNWQLLAGLDQLAALGFPLLVGASRKRFLGELLAGREPAGRDDATQAITALCAQAGVWGVRVHAVRPAADAVRVVAALREHADPGRMHS